jgi:hypothetical protein
MKLMKNYFTSIGEVRKHNMLQSCIICPRAFGTEVNKDTLITKTDRTGKHEFQKIFFFQKRHHNCEEN